MISAIINILLAMDYTVLKTGNLIGSVAPAASIFALTLSIILTDWTDSFNSARCHCPDVDIFIYIGYFP